MIIIGYFDGTERRGLLAYREPEGLTLQALGGFDPGPAPDGRNDAHNNGDLYTVVTTDDREEVFDGWLHPDAILPAWESTDARN